MKTRLIVLFTISLCITVSNAQSNLTLWYKSPAKVWEEALPVGNGRMGAMVFGDPRKERIQFNENTLYSGEPETPKNINIVPDLTHIQQLLNEGKIQKLEISYKINGLADSMKLINLSEIYISTLIPKKL